MLQASNRFIKIVKVFFLGFVLDVGFCLLVFDVVVLFPPQSCRLVGLVSFETKALCWYFFHLGDSLVLGYLFFDQSLLDAFHASQEGCYLHSLLLLSEESEFLFALLGEPCGSKLDDTALSLSHTHIMVSHTLAPFTITFTLHLPAPLTHH